MQYNGREKNKRILRGWNDNSYHPARPPEHVLVDTAEENGKTDFFPVTNIWHPFFFPVTTIWHPFFFPVTMFWKPFFSSGYHVINDILKPLKKAHTLSQSFRIKFLDSEIVIMFSKDSGPKNRQNGAIYGPRNWHYNS